MARLKDDTLFMRRGDHAASDRRIRPVLALLVFISSGLLLLSRLDHSMLGDIRWEVS